MGGVRSWFSSLHQSGGAAAGPEPLVGCTGGQEWGGGGWVVCNRDKAARVVLYSPQAQVDPPWWSLRRFRICSSSPGPLWLLLTSPFLEIRDSLVSGNHGKAPASRAADLSSIPGSGKSPAEGNGKPFQCSCIKISMDGGDWQRVRHDRATFTFPLRPTKAWPCNQPLCAGKFQCVILGTSWDRLGLAYDISNLSFPEVPGR